MVLREFARVLPEASIDAEVWAMAYELATRAGTRGVTVPTTDILIAACALRHGADLESADSDFDHLAPIWASRPNRPSLRVPRTGGVACRR